MNKIKVEWLTKSPSMYDYYNGIKGFHLKGGRLYEMEALDTLQNDFEVSINSNYIKRESGVSYLLKNHKKYIIGDVCILDPYIIAFGKFDLKKRNIAIIHHIDTSIADKSTLGRLFLNRLISNLKRVDKVIVVSEYWKEFLSNRGIINIEIIYNSFSMRNYNIKKNQIIEFKKKYKFPTDKPIIYLGQNSHGKGISNVLDVIDSSKYHLIVTGKTNHPSTSVHTYYFKNDEFPLFLASCDVVITMSTMMEGWNRTAHEAILAGTPVIGSGSAGMKELLIKTNQTILKEIDLLNYEIDKSLKKKSAGLNQERKFLENFDLTYFNLSWKSLVKEFV